MPCYHPILAYRDHPVGKVTLYAREQSHLYEHRTGQHFTVPCNRCSGCRRTQALAFATRCMHEAAQHEYNSYVTLTYDDKHLPSDLSLHHEHFVRFMKALRNRLCREERFILSDEQPSATLHCSYGTASHTLIPEIQLLKPIPPRFYMAGEYGSLYGRPHYHAILFGIGFPDKTYHGRTKAGAKLYTSAELDKLWRMGYASIGNVTFASAAYIARYVMKKRTGDGNKDIYEIIDPETGEIYFRQKEYNEMSRRPGIAKTWFDTYHEDYIYQDKIRLLDGRQVKPPRYYDKQLKRMDAAIYEHTKIARQLEQIAHAEESTPERLAVREIVDNAKARLQTRNLD